MKPVVPHHNYHPESWSVQARQLSNDMAWQVNHGLRTIEEVIQFFQISYRHSRIVNRAAKRFGRLVHEGKVKEKDAPC